MITVKQAVYGTPDFAACMAIRLEVFVAEQHVPVEEEADEYDAHALHVLALVKNLPAGTARAVEKEIGVWKIGRLAVQTSYRKQGIGLALMQEIEALCPARRFILNAQTHALSFYEKLGYKAKGPVFTEAGIAHRLMFKDV